MAIDDIDDLLEHTLDDYLVGLAQGVQQAQAALNQLTAPGLGAQSPVAYHIPKLEFELRLRLSIQGPVDGAQTSALAQTRASRLTFRPASPGAETQSAEAVSTIRGSFVSVPISGGRPPATLLTSMTPETPRDIRVSATLTDALGATLAGVDVQFNVDRERSATLSAARIPKFAALNVGTDVEKAVVRTDAEGRASTLLRVAPSEPVGAVVLVTIDASGASASLLVPVAPIPIVVSGTPDAVDR